MSVVREYFGRLADGKEVFLYTIRTGRLSAAVTDLGAVLVSLETPDRNGEMKDIVLGYDDVEHYLENPCCFGAPVGPNANRISGASFVIDGEEFHLPVNEKDNNLHSDKMFYKRLFNAEAGDNSVTFTLDLPDGDAGFRLDIAVAGNGHQERGIGEGLVLELESTVDIGRDGHQWLSLRAADSHYARRSGGSRRYRTQGHDRTANRLRRGIHHRTFDTGDGVVRDRHRHLLTIKRNLREAVGSFFSLPIHRCIFLDVLGAREGDLRILGTVETVNRIAVLVLINDPVTKLKVALLRRRDQVEARMV